MEGGLSWSPTGWHPTKPSSGARRATTHFRQRARCAIYRVPAPRHASWGAHNVATRGRLVPASYARAAMARVEGQEAPALTSLRSALEEALGLRFEGTGVIISSIPTLVQTLFYGVFSSWVLWSKDHPPTSKDRFDWHAAAWTLRVPMIRALFEQIATPSRLGPLGLVEVLDWTATVLNRVDRASFFAEFDQGQAVQYFYEPFLAAFDLSYARTLECGLRRRRACLHVEGGHGTPRRVGLARRPGRPECLRARPRQWHRLLLGGSLNRHSPDRTTFPGYSSRRDAADYNLAFQGRQMRPDSLKFLLSWTNHRPAKRKISKPLVYDQVSSLGSPFALYDPEP